MSARAPTAGKRGAARLFFLSLLVLIAALGLLLWRYRERAIAHLSATAMPFAPAAPDLGAPASVTLMVASDVDGSLVQQQRTLPLPAEPSARARTILNQLIAAYAQPTSTHPIAVKAEPAAPAVKTVFLMPLPKPTTAVPMPQGTLAVVDLTNAFAAAHPSGIEPETLTLLSLIATLHSNMPEIAEVRFLVDGAPRDTLAGHADLTNTYLASSAAAPGSPSATAPIGPGAAQ